MKTCFIDIETRGIPDEPHKFFAFVPPSHPFAHYTKEECERYFAHDVEVVVQQLIPREAFLKRFLA